MSESRREAKTAKGQNAEEGCLSLPSAPQFVGGHLEDVGDAPLCPERLPAPQTQERKGNGSDHADAASSEDSDGRHPSSGDPRADRSHGDRSEAVSSVRHDQSEEGRMPPGGCHPHVTGEHSSQLGADPRELGGEREREVRPEGRDPLAFFPGSELEDGVAAAGSVDEESTSFEVITPPSSRRSVPGPSQDGEAALRRPELAAQRQRGHGRRCRRAAWEERERGPSCSSYPHLGPCEWSWARPGATSPCQLAAHGHACSGRPCHLIVRVELELWPSCSSDPDLGRSWGRPGSTSRGLGHCPACQ